MSVTLASLGIVLIAYASYVDGLDAKDAAWGGTVICPDGAPPWEGTIPIRVRWVPLSNYPAREQLYVKLRDMVSRAQLKSFALERTELLIIADLKPADLQPLLAEGRLPTPGRPEVLAGAFAQLSEVTADDGDFHVVGRLKRNVAGLATSYLMPEDEAWDPLFERTTTGGWLDPNGVKKIREMKDPKSLPDRDKLIAGPAAARDTVALMSLVGLTMVAAGGMGVHRRAFVRMAERHTGVFGPALRAFGEHPALVRRMHAVMYGAFFFAMAAAVTMPQINAAVLAYITHEFSEGGLGYVGRAYQSGNVFLAAGATWVNNYLLQTVVLTVLVSLVVPCIGLLKTMASFALVGFGMAPLWSGMASSLTFHSITMALELEGYIYACAAVVIFWMRVFTAVRRRNRGALRDGFKIVLSGTLLVGVMLAIAGLYEATTLILLR